MLTPELKEVYSSNPRDIEALDTVELYHPNFTKRYFFVMDSDSHTFNLEDGSAQKFDAFGFSIVLPEKGSVQQDMSFVFDNVSRLGVRELEFASQNYSVPIKLTYRAYIKGMLEPQSTAYTLNLTNITMNDTTITARATRSDLTNRMFPFGREIYFDYRFVGLS